MTYVTNLEGHDFSIRWTNKFNKIALGYIGFVALYVYTEYNPSHWYKYDGIFLAILLLLLTRILIRGLSKGVTRINKIISAITINESDVTIETFSSDVLFGAIRREQLQINTSKSSTSYIETVADLEVRGLNECKCLIIFVDKKPYLLIAAFFDEFDVIKSSLDSR